MGSRRILIVGGVAGGASCAARLRRLDEEAEIILFERGPHVSFAGCGLPYYIGGVIEERQKLLVHTPESIGTRFNLDVRVESEVTSIDREKREVEVRTVDGKTYRERYDYIVLAPGAKPIRPRLDGIDLPGIFILRDVTDTDRIVEYIDKERCKKAVIIGGGYIGLEMAENLRRRGLEVAIVEKLDRVMALMDREMSNILVEHLQYKGVATWLGDGVAGFARSESGLEVKLESGQVLPADMVVLSIGVRPDVGLAREAGIEIGSVGGIKVDEHMRTNDERIYAVGDAVEVTHLVTGSPAIIALAGPANRQGRIAADNVCGRDSRYRGTQGTSIVKVFDLAAGGTGANEATLQKEGIEYLRVHIHPASHAGYYPHAHQMTLKVLFSPKDGRLLGAQAVGPEGVDKRIDVLATAMRAGMTVYDLEHLELAYAPPYGSAKDAVNMAGFVASNMLRGDVKTAYWSELDFPSSDGVVLLDVRTKGEWDRGHVEGALHIFVDEVRERLSEIPKDKEIYVYCAVGVRAYFACRILTQKGYDACNLNGGYRLFRACRPEVATGMDPRDWFAELKGEFCSAPARGAQAENG